MWRLASIAKVGKDSMVRGRANETNTSIRNERIRQSHQLSYEVMTPWDTKDDAM